MTTIFTIARLGAACAAGMLFASNAALADCQSDIDRVERFIDDPDANNLDMETDAQIRGVLEEAVKENRAGNEAKCQELINQAKQIGGVE
ncbi:hypothetical protein FMN50_10635 [Rhodobacterales bacterium]|nr:hypothetical protein FMN50_10635 [Rhodobacterales bacterium]